MPSKSHKKRSKKSSGDDPVNISDARRRKINDRKKVIKRRKNLSSKRKQDTFTAYSKYLKMISKEVTVIQSIINKMKEITDEYSKHDE